MDAWNNSKVRQKDVGDDLNDFVKDLEKEIMQSNGEENDNTDFIEMMKSIVGE
jgi:hypothetical protein